LIDEHDRNVSNPSNAGETEQPEPARKRAPRKKVPSTEAAAEGIEASVEPAANIESEPPKRRAPRKKATAEGETTTEPKPRTPRKKAQRSPRGL
jgi:hypothetical protein